jgi:hypothetical protein
VNAVPAATSASATPLGSAAVGLAPVSSAIVSSPPVSLAPVVVTPASTNPVRAVADRVMPPPSTVPSCASIARSCTGTEATSGDDSVSSTGSGSTLESDHEATPGEGVTQPQGVLPVVAMSYVKDASGFPEDTSVVLSRVALELILALRS